ncbi:MAG: hypothetical protein HY963_01230 [Ignavibacteriales bacterium]|jgi:hypothetical protein|nr:hypothetical protein [Ignavibacteriales bacterium]
MTELTIEKKIDRITKELHQIRRAQILLRKGKERNKSKRKSKTTSTEEWQKLALEVADKWDNKYSSIEEIRQQRNKNE